MTLLIAPTNLFTTTTPTVGIFWRVGDHLLIDRSTLDEAEKYGGCLTHGGGHCERWEAWQRLPADLWRRAGLPPAVKDSEYEEWPRGRIVFECEPVRFVMYMDRRLQIAPVIEALTGAFGLTQAAIVVRSDTHYR